MCELLGVSRSSFHRHWRASKPKREQTALRDEIQRLALDNKHYGYRRISALLKRQGWCVNHKRVLRLMREDNLLCLRRKGFVPATTNSAHPFTVYPNLAHRLLTTATNQLWVADITYVRLEEGFAYLAVVLDAHSRKVIGWELADHLRAELALAALDRALLEREVIPGGLIHHSDRGVQYASAEYVDRLKAHKILISMSRLAYPYDNAMAESFMKTLKTEEVEGRPYRDIAHARDNIEAFIEQVYNKTRLHSALRYQSPEEFEIESMYQLTTTPKALHMATNCPIFVTPFSE